MIYGSKLACTRRPAQTSAAQSSMVTPSRKMSQALVLNVLLSLNICRTASDWPTDEQLRVAMLEKRGLALYGTDNSDKLLLMKVHF